VNTIELLKPVLQGGIDRVNFFNGRALVRRRPKLQEGRQNRTTTGGSAKQSAPGLHGDSKYTKRQRRVDNPIVKVLKGCAINRRRPNRGLSRTSRLIRSTGAAATASDVTELPAFWSVQPDYQRQHSRRRSGVYLLSWRPPREARGKPPVEPGSIMVPRPCATKYSVETVKSTCPSEC